MEDNRLNIILHITKRSEWEKAKNSGIYHSATLNSEGFIHCSTPAQVVKTANSFFANQTGLVLLCIDSDKVQPEIKYEAVGEEKFPHIYGTLNIDAITQVINFEPDAKGYFQLPPELAKFIDT